MGSEMCIRDSHNSGIADMNAGGNIFLTGASRGIGAVIALDLARRCLLYTSDAADERSSVDLGGRRIIKKKKQT